MGECASPVAGYRTSDLCAATRGSLVPLVRGLLAVTGALRADARVVVQTALEDRVRLRCLRFPLLRMSFFAHAGIVRGTRDPQTGGLADCDVGGERRHLGDERRDRLRVELRACARVQLRERRLDRELAP